MPFSSMRLGRSLALPRLTVCSWVKALLGAMRLHLLLVA